MIFRLLAVMVLMGPWPALATALHPVSAGYLSGYSDGSIAGPDVPAFSSDRLRIFSGRAGVGTDPFVASEARAVFKFDVSSAPQIDDLMITVKNWGSESAPGLIAGCFRISVCPPLSSYSIFASHEAEMQISVADYAPEMVLYETKTAPGSVDAISLSPLLADLARPSILTIVVVPTSEGGSFFQARISEPPNRPSPIPVPAGWLMLTSIFSTAALWKISRYCGERAS